MSSAYKTIRNKLLFYAAIAIIASLLSFAASAASTAFADDSTTLTVTIPTVEEDVITPGRDFYVVGQISGDPLPEDARLTVDLRLVGSSIPVREVYATQRDFKDGLYIDYPLLSFDGPDRSVLRDSLMPDLVYDGVDLGTFADAWRKCYYDDTNFTAVFCGGNYSTDINLIGEDGTPYTPLAAGNYNIVVTAQESDGTLIATTQYPVTIGVVPNKVLTRFSPQEHLDNVMDIAAENNYRVYYTPLAGIWYPDEYIPSLADRDDIYCQIYPRWRLCDILEYMNGKAHFYVYNVTESSTSYSIEVAALQYTQSIYNSFRVAYNYYDIGEIALPNESLDGQLIPLPSNDYLQLTRVDYPSGTTSDNNLVMDDLNAMESDLTLSDGVIAEPGTTISLYGVVAPVQPSEEDIAWNSDNTFTVGNYAAQIRYTVTWGTGQFYTVYKPIGLNRIYSNGSSSNSILEFKHDIAIQPSMAGENVTVSLVALDAYGATLSGTSEVFAINVSE
ncbi:MAG: hypothetical protein LBT59_15850 [Clostridiales bacterium]|nr:hypothetical protein [Clostridiales bacterium]